MIDQKKKIYLSELLAAHGEVLSLSQIPAGQHRTADCIILVTMKSPQDAAKIQKEFGFQLFGYNALIVSEQWLAIHLED